MRTAAIIAAALIAVAPAAASAQVGSSNANTETRAFVGLNWAFGAGPPRADGVLGVARVRTKANDNSRGVRASVNIGLTDGFSFRGVRLTGMTGKNNAMAEAGVGFGNDGLFGTAGFWAPHVHGGADFNFGGGVEGYFGLHSQGEWDGPAEEQFER
ncbi:hypothetical protein [Alkalilacustris brevis]|uniref:hypothetical protein n=1 Tax=Alkalilacustris brevis TaxID=2026338 RepID=UPI000E0DDE4A|nr:hypothetical protein [Alkalilacustris brevis]